MARSDPTTTVGTAIVGAGISGLGAAIRLRQAGQDDLVVLEQADRIGGTWRDNTYPGCACDVPSPLYSFSFAPNPGWTREFARQGEILDYVEQVARDHGVHDDIRFGTRLEDARWDEASHTWHLDTSSGPVRARTLVAAAGPWHEPQLPDLPGLADFPGEVFHSSRWRHDVDLTGRRVAVVGTGASAVQFVPEIQPQVDQLTVFQRTAQWVLPKPDRAIGPTERRLRALPGVMAATRRLQYAAMEALGLGFRHPALLRVVQQIGRAQLHRHVDDPALRRALTPDHTLGCKRLLMSNAWYPALTAPNTTVRPTALARVEGDVLVGADGSRTSADVLILGTGFRILDMPIAGIVHDGDGQSLATRWQGSPRAHLGTGVAGVPNLFLLLGPNLGTGHTSAFTILEAQLDRVVAAHDAMTAAGATRIAPTAAAQRAFNERVQQALGTTVYNAGGCDSYYLADDGVNRFSWPWSSGRLVDEVATFRPSDHHVDTRLPAATAS